MARLWTSAYGLQSNQNNFDFHTSNGVIVVDFIDGKWWHHVTSLVSGTSQRTSHRMVNAATQGPFYFRGRFRPGTLPASANRIFRFAAGGSPLWLALTATGNIQLIDEAGTIGTSSTVVSTGTIYVFEVLFDSHLGPGACVATLRINGTTEVTASNRTFTSTTAQQVDVGGNLNNELQTVGDWRWTDIAINDTSVGGDQTSWPGLGHVAYAFPIGNGDANVGVTRGGADSGADWSQLDDVPPNDATDYISMATTSGKCLVRVTDPTDLGIGEAYRIKLVHVGGRVALASAATGNWLPSLKSQASGTELDGAPITLAVTTWFANNDTSGLQQYGVTAYADPQNGGAWTTARLRTMQIGAKTTDGTPATLVSGLWAVIEYVPFTVVVPAVSPNHLYAGLSIPSGGFQ